MALFSKNVITQVSGFDNPLITGELVWNQKTYWNLSLVANSAPVNLTTCTITASIVRRTISDLIDTRNGLSFNLANYTTTTPSPISLTISNKVDAAGTFTLQIDDTVWALVNTDPDLNIADVNPVCFTGRIKLAFAAAGSTPEDDSIIFLLFLVRSDGVITVST